MGYTGGTTPQPTYRSLGDHTETVQVDYDPESTTYSELLERFWRVHDPSHRAFSRQYMAAVFVHDEEQRAQAETGRDEVAKRLGRLVHVEILPASEFFLAEGYHQKYLLQQDGALFGEYERIYPDLWDLVASTAASKVNGYLYGCSGIETLRLELGSLGLSDSGNARLIELVRRRGR